MTDDREIATPLARRRATASAEQPGFAFANALDDRIETGWAVDDGQRPIPTATATIPLLASVDLDGTTRWRLTLRQEFGGYHTLRSVRI